MKTSLDHLPDTKQRELLRVRDILFEEFENLTINATAQWKKKTRLVAIILYGSYARGGWVDERLGSGGGYQSDYDILVVVSNAKLAEAILWHAAFDRMLHARGIKTPVQFIVEPLQRVNHALSEGQYFFTDIKSEGIALYQLKGKPLATAKPLTPEIARAQAQSYHDNTLPYARSFLRIARELGKNTDVVSMKHGAFELHQATEHTYAAILLTCTLYRPKTHDIEQLRSLSESLDARLIEAWPRYHQRDRTHFQLLKRAYVEARYSPVYEITPEQLHWLTERVEELHALAETVCKERLKAMG